MRHYTNIFSRWFGVFAEKKFPKPIQTIINKSYVQLMRVDLSEFETPSHYPSLNSFFTRKLKTPRSFDINPSVIISPADCLVMQQGQLDEHILLQIKGHTYSVSDLLSSHVKCIHAVRRGTFINFYLSPKDYHRYHAPFDMQVMRLIHIPGRLFPVNKPSLKKREQLYCINERVVLECSTNQSLVFYLVFIGAYNVGKIIFNFEPQLQTNLRKNYERVYEYRNLKIKKGDDLGCFEMGSSIVLIMQPDTIALKTATEQKLRFGDSVAIFSKEIQ